MSQLDLFSQSPLHPTNKNTIKEYTLNKKDEELTEYEHKHCVIFTFFLMNRTLCDVPFSWSDTFQTNKKMIKTNYSFTCK